MPNIEIFYVVFLILSFLITFLTYIFQKKYDKSRQESIINSEYIVLDSEETTINNKMDKIASDLLFLSDCLYTDNDKNLGISDVEADWISFSNRKKVYDQIRYIDENGNEIIRVNYKDGEAVLVPQNELQNKADRYYFSDTICLKNNEIYISKFDLNVENGEIEEPIKPTIRAAKPYYDSNNQLKGIVIINYLADDMLKQVASVANMSCGNIYLLNADGYWLFNNKDANKSWTFMYEEKQNESFKEQYPDTWKYISQNEKGIYKSNEGLFIFSGLEIEDAFSSSELDYSLIMNEGKSVLVSDVSASADVRYFDDAFLENIKTVILSYYIYYLIGGLISLLVAILVILKKNEKEQIRYFSEYDSMTGVYNRRAGFEKLNKILEKHTKDNWQSALCFMDINGLKQVNDTLGHEKGDELIKDVVKTIKKNIRDNDSLSRLGGDEFLLIFEGTDAIDAEQIWNRIIKDFEYINDNEKREIKRKIKIIREI